MPWTIPENRDRAVEPLDAEGVERIHNGAMRILEEIGILFLNAEALRILKDAGCEVDMETQRVRMDRAFVMEQVRKAPKSFTITPRNPDRQVTIGGANNLETATESFDLTSKIFYAPMVPNPTPFDPHDYGFDDPGFFGLGSTRVADFPAGTSPLPAGAAVTLHQPNFTIAGNTDKLFYWNGLGAVNFQPISTTQPGYAIAVPGRSPVAGLVETADLGVLDGRAQGLGGDPGRFHRP